MKLSAVVISREMVNPELHGFDEVLVESGSEPAAQRNRCIERATGDVIVFLDDDAMPVRGYADALRRIMADHSVVACGGPSIPSPRAAPLARLMHRVMAVASDDTWLRYTLAPEQFAPWRAFAGCSFAFRKACGERLDENFPLASGEDMDFQRRVSRHGRMVCSPHLAVHHDPHPVGQQLVRLFRWGRDNQGDQSHQLWNLLFPALWIAAAAAYAAGVVAWFCQGRKAT